MPDGATATSASGVLNIKEAAEWLKAHVETVRKMTRRGESPAFMVGKERRFHQDALRPWPAGQRPNSVGGNI